jgi:hypothetical protein
VPFLWFLVCLCVIGLASEVVGIIQQIPVQRGIDAHTARISGTFTELDKEGKFHDDKHYISYGYGDHGYKTALRGIPGNPEVGAKVCLEIDATKPENIRPCDTRGGLGDSLSGLIWGGSILTVSLLILWSRSEFSWSLDWLWTKSRPERPHPSSLRRKPTRRDRKRARKAQREELSDW